jgi:hypothetical protein
MKNTFCLLIFAAILFSGCYSYSQLPESEYSGQLIDTTLALRILLKNNSTIDLEAGKYVEVTEPANFVFGSGTIRESVNDDEDDYCGRFIGTLIDSGMTEPGDFDSAKRWYEYQTPENYLIRMNEGEFVVVDSAQGTGLWYFGSEDAVGERHPYSGRIAFDDIEKIFTEDISGARTAVCVIGIVTIAIPVLYYSPYIMWGIASALH